MKNYRIEQERAVITKTGMEFFFYPFPKEKIAVSPHIHSAIELLFITSGEFQIFADDSEFWVTEGCTVLLRSNTIHRIYSHGEQDGGYYVFKFSPSLIMDFSLPEYRSAYLLHLALNTKNEKSVWTAAESASNGLHRALDLLIREAENPAPGSDIAMRVGAGSILLALIRDLLSEKEEYPHKRSPGKDAVRHIYDVTVYINTHYAEPLTAEECAQMAYMSSSYFSRIFYQITGRSFKEYLNITRINRAEKMLLTTERTVTEIASDCGFNNVAYFISVYKKAKGITPLATRNRK